MYFGFAVMRLDEIDDGGGEIVLAREFYAVGHVFDDYFSAVLGTDALVGTDIRRLIFDEEAGIPHFAYVVIKSAGAHEQRVASAYFANHGFGYVRHLKSVLCRAGRPLGQIAQQFAVGVRQFDQTRNGDEAE